MISINKIREKSGLLLIIVGIAMGAFILGDFFTSKTSFDRFDVGVVNGEAIEAAYFETKVDEQIQGLKQVNQKVDEATTEQIRNQVWSDIVRENVLDGQLEEVGLTVSQEEYDDVRFGNNILADFKNDQNFKDPQTGQFNPQSVKQYFSYIQENFPLLWKSQRDRILITRKVNKYNALIKKALYVNSVEAENDYLANNQKFNINFVVKKFVTVEDSLVKPTDEELKKYFNEHKNEEKYKQQASRSFDYVVFDIKPSDADEQDVLKKLTALKAEFETTTNDTSFVTRNTESRNFNVEVYAKGSADPATDTAIIKGTKGNVIGPFKQGNQYRLVKIMVNGMVPEANARHILLRPTETATVEQLKVKADSLMKAIKKNNNFADVARQVSEDRGSAEQGGNLDWFGEGMMVPPFEKACLEGKKGDMTVVETQFGVHLIEVLDKRQTEQIKIASIDKTVQPSRETSNAIYDEASAFSINSNTADLFNKAVEEKNYAKQSAPNIRPQDKFVPGIEEPTQILRWVNKSEIGKVSEPIESGNKFVVCLLTKVTEEGVPVFEDIKEQIEAEVIKEKKAEYISKMIKGTTLEAVANDLKETVQSANDLSMSMSVIPNGGRELKIIGIASTLPVNSVSKPIVGENGVYVIAVTNKIEAPKNTDFTASKNNLKSSSVNRVDAGAYGALIEKAKVKDERYKMY